MRFVIECESPDSRAAVVSFAARLFRDGALAVNREVSCTSSSSRARPGDVALCVRLATTRQAPSRVRSQAYLLQITPASIEIQSEGMPGIRHAMQTLRQLVAHARSHIPCMKIVDWPDFPHRGILLDISRDKVPTMKTLRGLVKQFAAWKINQLQLYTEHTFAYRGHERVWRDASPMTSVQIGTLDLMCRSYGIELVPNQNSLGHMERWLRHPAYAPLAEYDGPYKTPWGETRTTPTTLNPVNPRSIRLVASLYKQLLPNFTSGTLNVGCDEPFELGQGKSRKSFRTRGAGRVYFDYLMKIRRAAAAHGRRIQFWSDWIQREPDMIERLPRDVIPLVWGYEADHPFKKECSRPAVLELEFYVCPGTSSWCSFAGRTTNMIENLRRAANVGRRCGAAGYLITDWGDFGHRQMLPVSYPAFLLGAAISWCASSNAHIDLAAELSRHVFQDATGRLARAWLDAGRVHEETGIAMKNRTILFAAMQGQLGDSTPMTEVQPAAIARMRSRIARIRRSAARARPRCADAGLIQDELRHTLDVLEHACGRLALPLQKSNSSGVGALSREIQDIMRSHARLWRCRNRPGGLRNSLEDFRANALEYSALRVHPPNSLP